MESLKKILKNKKSVKIEPPEEKVRKILDFAERTAKRPNTIKKLLTTKTVKKNNYDVTRYIPKIKQGGSTKKPEIKKIC